LALWNFGLRVVRFFNVFNGQFAEHGMFGKRIKSFCGAKPTQKLRWMDAWLGIGVASYGDFT
jgi:hypothetical protein